MIYAKMVPCKCSAEFQKRLRGGHIVDHASVGALECAKQNADWGACCVAGHHGGLQDIDDLTVRTGSDHKRSYGFAPDIVGIFAVMSCATRFITEKCAAFAVVV